MTMLLLSSCCLSILFMLAHLLATVQTIILSFVDRLIWHMQTLGRFRLDVFSFLLLLLLLSNNWKIISITPIEWNWPFENHRELTNCERIFVSTPLALFKFMISMLKMTMQRDRADCCSQSSVWAQIKRDKVVQWERLLRETKRIGMFVSIQ